MSLDMDGPAPMEFGDRVEFEVLEERGQSATLECPACGFVFDVDIRTGDNLEWDRPNKCMAAVCPVCQRMQQ
jgi:rubredoxin